MKILIVGPSTKEKLAGGAHIRTILQAFNKMKINYTLISYDPYSNMNSISTLDHSYGKEIIITIKSNYYRLLKMFLITFFELFYVFIKSFNVDYIWTYGGSTLANVPTILISKITKKKIIYELTDIEIEVNESFQKMMLKLSDIIVVNSNYLINYIKNLDVDENKIYYLPCWIDTDEFKYSKEGRKYFRNLWNLNDFDIVIGYAGVSNKGEGLRHLINALNIVINKEKKEIYAPLLAINRKTIGEWDDVNQISKEYGIEHYVYTIPPIEHKKVREYLSACDILCAPKINNKNNRAAIPIKLIEYMSISKPIIITDYGEISSVVRNNKEALLTQSENAEDIAKAIIKLINNEKFANKLALNARKRVEKYFSIESTIEKMKIFLRK